MWLVKNSGMIVGLEFFAFLRLFPEGERGGYQLMTARLLIKVSSSACFRTWAAVTLHVLVAWRCGATITNEARLRGAPTNPNEPTDRPRPTAAARPLADRSSWSEAEACA